MFIEPQISSLQSKKGWLEVICGSMFSGKTEELIRRLKRAQIASLSVEIFKPAVDKRYAEEAIVSHNANAIASTAVEHSQHILLLYQGAAVVGIDEAQFFDDGIVDVCNTLAAKGVRVVIAGLDMDFKGKPFGPMPHLLSVAEYVTKLHAICVKCGDIANNSFRKTTNQNQFLLGEIEAYEPRCRKCFSEEKNM